MKKPDSYEDVLKELEEVNEMMEEAEEVVDKDFKFEYAYESLTERYSAYKRRTSNV